MPTKDPKKPKVNRDKGTDDSELIVKIIIGIFVFVGLLFLDKCSCESDYDDTWDRIDHTIKTDPYFDQW